MAIFVTGISLMLFSRTGLRHRRERFVCVCVCVCVCVVCVCVCVCACVCVCTLVCGMRVCCVYIIVA